ncbi:MAG: hypothetical protein QOE90_2590 [Thermoplasmata archaeon]|jgi:hypothetical protein|nr:hypothetical protein [Thermoplasmata archaeon]
MLPAQSRASMRPLLLATLVLVLALAGCTGGNTTTSSTPASSTPASSTPETSTPASTTPASSTPASTTPVTTTPGTPTILDESSFTVTTPGAPSMVAVGKPFNVTVHVAGAVQFSSDHIGAHYATSPQAAPDAATMTACAHTPGSLPGDFVVACNVSAPGTIYLYGHARVTENNVTHNYWGPQQQIRVANATVTVTQGTGLPLAGQPVQFTIAVAGDAGSAAFVNATFGGNSTAAPSFAAYPNGCTQTSGAVPHNYTISCTFPTAGTYYLRGVVLYGDLATSQALFWSDELKVTVAGLGIGG